jgi:acyl carrier protein
MDRQEIETKVADCMAALSWGEREKFTPDAKLGADLGVDSLDLVQLVICVEEELNVEIPDEALDGRINDVTVGEVFDVVAKYVDERAAA